MTYSEKIGVSAFVLGLVWGIGLWWASFPKLYVLGAFTLASLGFLVLTLRQEAGDTTPDACDVCSDDLLDHEGITLDLCANCEREVRVACERGGDEVEFTVNEDGEVVG